MAKKVSKGSIILEVLIVLVALLLVAVILVPNKIWKEENQVTTQCRANINSLYEAERFYYRATESYTDSLSKLLAFVQSDSGLIQKQKLVSLTNSFTKVMDNILNIPAVSEVSSISQSSDEITGDLQGNDRYFRSYGDLIQSSEQLLRDFANFDSSTAIPNYSRTKLFIDSLRNLKDEVTDHTLQNGILRAISYVDSIDTYMGRVEKAKVESAFNDVNTKVNNFIVAVKNTDIVKVSSVADRLKKFNERIKTSINNFKALDISKDTQLLQSERQNLAELHQKFLSPDFFILTQRYALTKMNETDSLLLHLSQENFYCPDDNKLYLFGYKEGNTSLTVECPNLLTQFHQKFVDDVDPIKGLPLFAVVDSLDTVFAKTKDVLNKNRELLRRETDILLSIKEITAEMDNMGQVFFYTYTKDLNSFISNIQTEKKISVVKPAIEDILNPMDTLATRMTSGDISDLEQKVEYFGNKIQKVDSMISATRLPSRVRRSIQSNTAVYQPAYQLLVQIKSTLKPSYAQAVKDAGSNLENDLIHLLEGTNQTMYVIFNKKHINHGYIQDGEKSWEKK